MHTLRAFFARLRRPSLWIAGAVCAVTLIGATSELFQQRSAEADLTGPTARDRQVTLVVSTLLRREHLSKHPMDDEVSARALDNYLELFDPLKLYFEQADIDEFRQKRADLDDLVQKGDIQFAYTVFDRFTQRIEQRVTLVEDLLKQEFDFAIDEQRVLDPEKLTYPTAAEEVRNRWRKRIKHDLLVLKSDKENPLTGQAARDKLLRRYRNFAKRMQQTNQDDLLEHYLTSFATAFDPHTTYMSPSSLENFRMLMRLSLEGIGASLKVDDGYTIVNKIIPGGAADKQGDLKAEDRIVSVGQDEEGELVDVIDMRLQDVVKLIRGSAGTTVRLGVQSPPSTTTKIVKITRAKIELKDSEALGQVFEEGKKEDGTPLKIGVIDLPSFYMDMEAARLGGSNYKSTTRDVRRILQSFTEQGVDAVVLDLRRNGGGSLTEAISLTGLFIDSGPVVQVKDSGERVQHYDDDEAGMAWSGPLVVVTSKFSASASEILAGAVQDYRRGLIVGDPATHGKGTVQSLLDLGTQLFRVPNPPNLGALKITMQQFYRPAGDSTQKRGVLADIVLPSITAQMDVAETDLDYAIEFDRVEASTFDRLDLVAPQMLAELKARSAVRREGSEDFQDLAKDIEQYRTQKERKAVMLNEEKFMAERAKLDADREDEKLLEDQLDNDRLTIKRDYYLDEVIAITQDYLRLLKRNQVAAVN